ncbi:thioredoxin [Actinomadura madurae]|nr:thioredoxin [Actinomadura madurae]MCP9952514.1 thioredoxin [Actinomadura madurae]MCP9969276.1 thioredoxin [Actinomadura madurae]MCP9981751.1 thioredoxin [Actinomadura madurae]MCQ0006734.1 thioredoxin [Actinomadura madurae]MCQ0017959.1 thioredoxin [Actinomadura madurae]
MITLTAENFDEQVLRAGKPVLVEFWADWCPPCKMIAPILEQIEAEHGDRLTIAKLNGDDHPQIVSRYGVMGFPTMSLFRDGEVVRQIVGAKPKRALLADLDGHF